MTAPLAFPLEPTPIRVPDEVLDDLRARLALTRPPLDEGNEDWSYGVPASYLRELVAGHFIPWENPGARVTDLRRTFHDRRG